MREEAPEIKDSCELPDGDAGNRTLDSLGRLAGALKSRVIPPASSSSFQSKVHGKVV